MTARKALPTYRCQKKKSGRHRAFVELNGDRVYLGTWDTPESRQEYDRVVREWLSNGRTIAIPTDQLTVTSLCARFWDAIQGQYAKAANFRPALRALRQLYGDVLARDFGPKSLKIVRDDMIAKGWCRKYVNGQVDRIRKMFKWAASEELVPAGMFEALKTVDGLRRGKTVAIDHAPITVVPDAHVNPIKNHVARQVWAMVQLQRLSGARPGELVILRSVDIDTTSAKKRKVWIYRPAHHKNAHREKPRVICFGERAQRIIGPFLTDRPVDSYLFSPREADEERKAAMRGGRKTPVQPSQRDRSKDNPQRKPRDRYTTMTYARAISRGVKKAFRPEGMSNKAFAKWKCPQHWHPNQLRHNSLTQVRHAHGLEAAQVWAGHSKVETTQIYAEQNLSLALEIARKIG